MGKLNVAQLVAAVKGEIVAAEQTAKQEQNGMFELEQLELEIKFTVSHEEGGKAGLDVVVASAGVDTKRGSEEVQTVKLLFKAIKRRPGGEGSGEVEMESATPPGVRGIGPLKQDPLGGWKPQGPVVKPPQLPGGGGTGGGGPLKF